MFSIMLDTCLACSSLMSMPIDLAISVICSGLMFFIIEDIASRTFGSAICFCMAAMSGMPLPSIPPAPFIEAAISLMRFMSSGFMSFIVSAAILAISGVIFGMPGIVGADAAMASICSGDMLAICSAARFITSGSFSIISLICFIMSGEDAAGASGTSAATLVSSFSPLSSSDARTSSSDARTAESDSSSSSALRRSAAAFCRSPLPLCPSPRR